MSCEIGPGHRAAGGLCFSDRCNAMKEVEKYVRSDLFR